MLEKTIKFLKEVRSELRKVVWPTRQQVIASTMVVIAMVLLVGLFVAGVDVLLAYAFQQFGL